MSVRADNRRQLLSADVIVDAAERIATAEGLDAVTLRGVAQAVGVTPMALYRHVGGIDDLLGALVERITDRYRPPRQPKDRDAVAMLVWWGRVLFGLFTSQPVAAQVFARQPVTTQRLRGLAEPVLAALLEEGFTDDEAVVAYRSVLSLTVGFSTLHNKWRADGPPSRARVDDIADVIRSAATTEGLPSMERLANRLATPYPVEDFILAVRSLVSGIERARRH